jgi:hypothetical protein
MKAERGLCRFLLAGFLAALFACDAVGVVTNRWTQVAGGQFEASGNWTPAGPPTSEDTALFDAGSTTGRIRVTFSGSAAVTNRTANFTMSRNGVSNRWDFAIADNDGPTVYEAGYTRMGNNWLYYTDLLISTGKLVSSQVLTAIGGRTWVTLDGPQSAWQIDDYLANSSGAEFNLTVQNGASLAALAKNGGVSGTGNARHDIGSKRPDADLNRVMTIRVTGTNSTLLLTGAPTEYKATGNCRFELLDGAYAAFANLSILASDRPFITVVSNARLETAAFVIASPGPSRTNDMTLVNSTLVSSGQVHVAEYTGTAS